MIPKKRSLCCVPSLILVTTMALLAQDVRVENAQVESASISGDLSSTVRSIVGDRKGPAWLGYSVPMLEGRGDMCCSSDGDCICSLEGDRRRIASSSQDAVTRLEGGRRLAVLLRFEDGAVGRVAAFSQSCRVDAGGLPFIWLGQADPSQSVGLLSDQIASSASRLRWSGAMTAIAYHSDGSADRALLGFLDPQRQEVKIRKQAAFWVGQTRGTEGLTVLRKVLRDDPSAEVRKQAVFGIYVSDAPGAEEALIQAARQTDDRHVRKQGIFWLSQKAGRKSVEAIVDAVENDPETDIKLQAVFALSQLPNEEGIPHLIELARESPNPKLRKRAIFWLGQSGSPRALSFFEEVLRK